MAIKEIQDSQDDISTPYDQFVLFGDSITQMASNQDRGFAFQAALQDAYIRKLDVINRGLSGYTTAHAIKAFPKILPPPNKATVRFMTIFFGANDACLPGQDQHVPLSQYRENLKMIVQHPNTRAQKSRLIIITPPPVNEYQLESFDASKNAPHPSRTANHTKLYAETARQVGASLNVPVVDLWTAFMQTTGWHDGQPLVGSREVPNNERLARLFTDGLHLTPDGYRIVYDQLMQVIRTNWPDQNPDKLPMVFPGWGEAPK